MAAIIKREFADVQFAGLQTNRVGKLKKQCSRNMAGKYPQTDSSRMESISLERRKNPGLYCWCEIFVATVFSLTFSESFSSYLTKIYLEFAVNTF